MTASAVSSNVCCIAILPFWIQSKEQNQENGYIILLFLGWDTSCWAEVEGESELESELLKIFRLRSPGLNNKLFDLVVLDGYLLQWLYYYVAYYLLAGALLLLHIILPLY